MLTTWQTVRRFAITTTAALLTACAADAPSAPDAADISAALSVTAGLTGDERDAVTAIRRATARYQKLDAAIRDGFVLLHECEQRNEGVVGTVYVNFDRLLDATIDPNSPDALVYTPGPNGQPTLAAAEFAVLYAQWPHADAPTFLGNRFQKEDEFQVYGLHVWLWQDNPNGLFAEANPRLSCGA